MRSQNLPDGKQPQCCGGRRLWLPSNINRGRPPDSRDSSLLSPPLYLSSPHLHDPLETLATICRAIICPPTHDVRRSLPTPIDANHFLPTQSLFYGPATFVSTRVSPSHAQSSHAASTHPYGTRHGSGLCQPSSCQSITAMFTFRLNVPCSSHRKALVTGLCSIFDIPSLVLGRTRKVHASAATLLPPLHLSSSTGVALRPSTMLDAHVSGHTVCDSTLPTHVSAEFLTNPCSFS